MIYVIYHQVKPGIDCPDGIAAAWVVRRHLRVPGMSDIEYVGRCYDDTRPLPEFRSGDEIYIVDFSFKASIVKGWMNQGCKVVIYDHHKTAEEEMQKLMDGSLSDHLKKGKSSIKFDMGESGATLAWKEMSGGIEPPEFLKHIKDRDLWNFDLDGTQEIHEAMGAMGRSFELFDALMADKSNTILYGLKNAGKRLLEPKRRAIVEECERAEWGEVAGYKGVLFVRLKPDGWKIA